MKSIVTPEAPCWSASVNTILLGSGIELFQLVKNWDVEVSCFCPFKSCEKSIYPNRTVSAVDILSKEEEVIEDPWVWAVDLSSKYIFIWWTQPCDAKTDGGIDNATSVPDKDNLISFVTIGSGSGSGSGSGAGSGSGVSGSGSGSGSVTEDDTQTVGGVVLWS